MALVVDEIVDIVEQKLDIELVSQRPGVLGSALIRGQATEVIDVGHYLPLAFDDWQDWRERRNTVVRHRVLLVDDSQFFRNMLAPLLNAAGYSVASAASRKLRTNAIARLLSSKGTNARHAAGRSGMIRSVSSVTIPSVPSAPMKRSIRSRPGALK